VDHFHFRSQVDYYYDNQVLPSCALVFTLTFPRGQLIGVIYGGWSQVSYFSYDQPNRVTLKYQQINTTNYQTQAGYNKAIIGQPHLSSCTVTYNSSGTAFCDLALAGFQIIALLRT
jgi:hypothetical protein